jgi:hypothetical protein
LAGTGRAIGRNEISPGEEVGLDSWPPASVHRDCESHLIDRLSVPADSPCEALTR